MRIPSTRPQDAGKGLSIMDKHRETQLSRRAFLKGSAAGALGLAASGLFGGVAVAEAAGTYKPGTYSATAQGMGTVTVTMTFDAEAITDVVVDVSGETEGIGAGLGEQFAKQLLENQGTGIDAVSGATVTSNAVTQAAEACIAQAKGDSVLVATAAEEAPTWRTAPAPIPDSEIAATIETDVAIIGLGHAGLAAYRELAEQGANVVAIEAQPRETWWTIGHDVGHINSQFLKGRGVPEVDPVEFANNWQVQAQGKSNPALVMKFAQNCGSAIDWYLDPVDPALVEMAHVTHWPDNEYTIHQLNNGLRYYAGTAQWWEDSWKGVPGTPNNTEGMEVKNLSWANYDHVEKNYPNATALFGTKGAQLVKDGGKVVGVIAKRADGSYVKVLGAKGVVLAGGGFAANPEMCKDLLPNIDRIFTENEGFMGPMGRDGSTIQMGVWAGGRLEGELSTMNFDSMSLPDGIPGSLWVDGNGQRFQNEGFAGTELNGFISARMKRGPIISIYDSTYDTQILRGFPGHGSFDYGNPDAIAAKLADFAAAKDAGAEGANGFYCAETIEELAGYIGVDPAALTATVERYNAVCESGVDTDFGKDPRFLNPVKEGPFYAHVTTPSLGFALVTTGGFVTTNDQQVLDAAYAPIEGLYATGNNCGLRFGPAYITPIPGVSIGMCITLGRELGKVLAAK